MLLGPTKLRPWPEQKTKTTRQERDLLPTRELLANMLNEHPDTPAFIMEKEPASDSDRSFTSKFLRIISEKNVKSFFIHWPRRAQMNGLDVEIGHILGWLERDEIAPDDVHIFFEKGVVRQDEDGVLFNEQGNRTWYYSDLLAYNCPFYMWKTPRGLFNNIEVASEEHRARHVAPFRAAQATRHK